MSPSSHDRGLRTKVRDHNTDQNSHRQSRCIAVDFAALGAAMMALGVSSLDLPCLREVQSLLWSRNHNSCQSAKIFQTGEKSKVFYPLICLGTNMYNHSMAVRLDFVPVWVGALLLVAMGGIAGAKEAVPEEVDSELWHYEPTGEFEVRIRVMVPPLRKRLFDAWATAFREFHPNVKVETRSATRAEIIDAMAERRIEIGALEWRLSLDERDEIGKGFRKAGEYFDHGLPVSLSAMVVVVHPDNPVVDRGLTMAELERIWGEREPPKLWGELGLEGEWKDVPIRVLDTSAGSPDRRHFRRRVFPFGGEHDSPPLHSLVVSDVVKAVAKQRGAIGYIAIEAQAPSVAIVPLADHREHVLPTKESIRDFEYPLPRAVFVMLRGAVHDRRTPQAAFIHFMNSQEGQAVALGIGAIPVTLHALERMDRVRYGAAMVDPPNELPRFPWPPPKASAQDVLPRELLKDEQGKRLPTLGAVADHLVTGLDAVGNHERSFYWIPGGFTLVAATEQIDENGKPLPEPDRWSADVAKSRKWSLRGLLKALLKPDQGRWRCVAFLVTDQRPDKTGPEPSPAEIAGWAGDGMATLPEVIRIQEFSEDHYVQARIFELEKQTPDHEPEIVQSSTWQGRDHLKHGGLWKTLGGTE